MSTISKSYHMNVKSDLKSNSKSYIYYHQELSPPKNLSLYREIKKELLQKPNKPLMCFICFTKLSTFYCMPPFDCNILIPICGFDCMKYVPSTCVTLSERNDTKTGCVESGTSIHLDSQLYKKIETMINNCKIETMNNNCKIETMNNNCKIETMNNNCKKVSSSKKRRLRRKFNSTHIV